MSSTKSNDGKNRFRCNNGVPVIDETAAAPITVIEPALKALTETAVIVPNILTAALLPKKVEVNWVPAVFVWNILRFVCPLAADVVSTIGS